MFIFQLVACRQLLPSVTLLSHIPLPACLRASYISPLELQLLRMIVILSAVRDNILSYPFRCGFLSNSFPLPVIEWFLLLQTFSIILWLLLFTYASHLTLSLLRDWNWGFPRSHITLSIAFVVRATPPFGHARALWGFFLFGLATFDYLRQSSSNALTPFSVFWCSSLKSS